MRLARIALSVLLILSAAVTFVLAAGEDPSLIHPEQIDHCLKSPTAAGIDLNVETNPYYLRGDYDGDGRPDYAVAIRGRNTKRNGVLVCTGNGRTFLLGADQRTTQPFSDMPNDNFFAPNWAVYSKEETRALRQWKGITAALPPRLVRGESIAMIWEDGISIIYWDGHAYRWAAPTK